MSVLLDEETVVIDHLDFTVTCEVVGSDGPCTEEADYQMECVACGGMCGLLCISHAIYARTSGRTLTHTACGIRGPLRDIVIVVPL